MKPKYSWFLQGLLVLALVAAIAPAAMANSNTVSYQGTLRDATLNPVADGGYPMQFAIYNSDVGGTLLWGPEQYPSVATNHGRFSVYLGSILPLGTLFADNGMLWLEISADTGTGMETYAPRVALASVPYAQHAKTAGNAAHAETATTADSATRADSADNADNADTLQGLAASAFAAAGHTHALNDLGNVNVPSPANNHLLAWNSSTSQWRNVAPPPAISDQSASGFVRIGNLQICWGRAFLSGTNHVRSFSFTFPAAFSQVPVVTNGINSTSSGYVYSVYNHSISTTVYSGSIMEAHSARASSTVVTMNYMAIGRWQ